MRQLRDFRNSGRYGIYPVQTTNTLVEGSVAIAASDAGIYVGQSRNVVVRHNKASFNVAGIEIENTIGADVYENEAVDNTGGILVFNMPQIPQRGHSTRVYNNQVHNNNTRNFAAPGTAVSGVPSGSGIIVNSNDRVEIFDNDVTNNNTANVVLSSYFSANYAGQKELAEEFDPYPEEIYIYDNRFDGGGTAPGSDYLAQLHELPVIVREFSDTEVLEVAIIENIQRADLNAIDEAAGYRQLMDRFGHTQEQLSQALGKSRSHIANLMRLLNLPDDVQTYVIEGLLSAGHARALVGHENANELARKIIQQELSVRETEKLVKGDTAKSPRNSTNRVSGGKKDPDTVQIEQEISATLGMKVAIDHEAGGEAGKISVQYKSLDQLDDLLRILSSN